MNSFSFRVSEEAFERLSKFLVAEFKIPSCQIAALHKFELRSPDSFSQMRVVYFLEEEFGIQVELSEIRSENLGSIAKILSFVEAKRSGTSK